MAVANIENKYLRRTALVISMILMAVFWATPCWAFGLVVLTFDGLREGITEWWRIMCDEVRLLVAGFRDIWKDAA